MQQEYINEIRADEKDISDDEIFRNYFRYHNPLFFAKDVLRAKQAKNEQLVNNINGGFIELRNTIIKKNSWKWKSK